MVGWIVCCTLCCYIPLSCVFVCNSVWQVYVVYSKMIFNKWICWSYIGINIFIRTALASSLIGSFATFSNCIVYVNVWYCNTMKKYIQIFELKCWIPQLSHYMVCLSTVGLNIWGKHAQEYADSTIFAIEF